MKVAALAARIVTAIALVVNAWLHFRLAGPFDAIAGDLVTQGELFRIQAVVNVLAALLVVAVPRAWPAILAALVAAGGLALLVASVYVPLDLSALGLPVIFEPVWYPDKAAAAIAQCLAVLGGLAALALRPQNATVGES